MIQDSDVWRWVFVVSHTQRMRTQTRKGKLKQDTVLLQKRKAREYSSPKREGIRMEYQQTKLSRGILADSAV